jgi:replicative DNA helicase
VQKAELEKNLGHVVIDYLQLMQGRGKTESRQQEVRGDLQLASRYLPRS